MLRRFVEKRERNGWFRLLILLTQALPAWRLYIEVYFRLFTGWVNSQLHTVRVSNNIIYISRISLGAQTVLNGVVAPCGGVNNKVP